MMTPQDQPHLHKYSSSVSTLQSSSTAVFDDAIIIQVLDKLVGQQSSLQIVPIVGMGGIGKTTFSRSICGNPLIVQHFDTLAWVTISQVYNRRNILQLLCQELKVSIVDLSKKSEDEIGLVLYQYLFGRRYLTVMDDMWSIDAWDKVKSFFPDNNNGSRIMITTRLSNLAFDLSGCHGFQMQFLHEEKSWGLLCKIVFGKLDCPTELEKVGKEIARKCRGLPLSIAVIGGLLKKSNMTQTYWMNTLENISSIINLENDEYTLRILRTSYRELPMHLKPCFLYMGIFPEDKEIRVSLLFELWVAEGIVRPIDDKSLEEVAKEYLEELIDRNLILVAKSKWNGEVKLCKIHDVLRDVCLREAQKQKFFCVLRQQKDHTPQDINMHRMHVIWGKGSPSVRLRSLRVYSLFDEGATDSNNAIFKHVNLRYLSLKMESKVVSSLRYLCCLLWNLQTLKIGHFDPFFYRQMMAPSEIWEMRLLKHVKLYNFVLPDPPNGEHNLVLKYLETLCVMNFKFSEEVIKRIPNVKKLKVIYKRGIDDEEEGLPNFSMYNIGRLQKLESLNLLVDNMELYDIRRNLVSFPHSLKKLSLYRTGLSWEELTIRIGSLPLLQVLKLNPFACTGAKWETSEGQFCSLKVLKIHMCSDLKYWVTDSAHFPRLEHLRIYFIYLKEIPSSIGDIPTLKSIRLEDCSKSVQHSAKRIKVEQQENGNEDLQIIIDGKVVQVDSDEENQEEDEYYSDEGDQFDLDED